MVFWTLRGGIPTNEQALRMADEALRVNGAVVARTSAACAAGLAPINIPCGQAPSPARRNIDDQLGGLAGLARACADTRSLNASKVNNPRNRPYRGPYCRFSETNPAGGCIRAIRQSNPNLESKRRNRKAYIDPQKERH
jgi:hypothetical protein